MRGQWRALRQFLLKESVRGVSNDGINASERILCLNAHQVNWSPMVSVDGLASIGPAGSDAHAQSVRTQGAGLAGVDGLADGYAAAGVQQAHSKSCPRRWDGL